jgi:uncharacterized protein (TIGR02145 family)
VPNGTIPAKLAFPWAWVGKQRDGDTKMKKVKLALVAMAGIVCFVCGCKEAAAAKGSSTDQTDGKEETVTKSSFTDPRDGKNYKYVKIGDQIWMAQNLDYAGKNNDIGACYNKDSKNCQKYGALYNWEEAMKVCPSGWHLPSDKEWQTLVDFAGGDKVAGKKLKAKNGWTPSKDDIRAIDNELVLLETMVENGNFSTRAEKEQKVYAEQAIKEKWAAYDYKCKYTTKETTARGEVIVTEHDNCPTDELGFSALPGGFGFPSGNFGAVGISGNWWSATEGNVSNAWDRVVLYNLVEVGRRDSDKSYFSSVRCLKDKTAEEKAEAEAKLEAMKKANSGTFTDTRDRKNYKTIKIGEQNWMAENLNYEAEGSKCYDNKPENCQKYGRLYDKNTAMKICPKGWHLPSGEEWQTLGNFAGGNNSDETKLKAKSGWELDGNGTDIYGFAALPGGMGNFDGIFKGVGKYGEWFNADGGYWIMLYDNNPDNTRNDRDLDGYYVDLLSVRCLQD